MLPATAMLPAVATVPAVAMLPARPEGRARIAVFSSEPRRRTRGTG
jgi:hypothetical protein